MILSQTAIQKIRHRDGLKTRNRLAYELNVHQNTIERWLENNDDNLTKASALQVIREETGLTDSEILTESN